MERQRINVLDIPIDVLPPGTFESAIQELLLKDGPRQIIFLSVWDLLKARGKNDFAQAVKSADLVIPVSKSIVRGAVFLNQPAPERYNPFEAVISILYTLDAQNRSLYILGGKKKVLMEAERNVRATFPSLRIVGRYIGHYPQSMENDIISAIRKSSPSVILLSEGIPDKKNWYYRRRAHFSGSFTKESGIFVHYPEAVGVFSKTAKRVSNTVFDKGLEIWTEIFHNPFKIFLIFPYIYYKILLFTHHFSGKN
jgi:N-acetylglucosaminyldiphosphoundecaprenol N-acetyl-beta-D-mannosaminyltransferase